MKFSKVVPSQSGYYWVVNKDYPDPFIAFIQKDFGYPFLVHMWPTCAGKTMFMEEQNIYRFGDKIEKPEPKDNVIE